MEGGALIEGSRWSAPTWHHPTEGVTLAEYAAELGVAVSTINQTWRKRYPEHWPEPVDRRGRTHLYRWEDLDRLARRVR